MDDNVEEQYYLKVDNYEKTINEMIHKFWQRKVLVDVTLACENYGKIEYLEAHQIILSACSPYFESIFVQNTHPHPIVYLKGVKRHELENILTFMYTGELNLERSKIQAILETAKSLMIKGLSEEVYDDIRSSKASDADTRLWANTRKNRDIQQIELASENDSRIDHSNSSQQVNNYGSDGVSYPEWRQNANVLLSTNQFANPMMNRLPDQKMNFSVEEYCKRQTTKKLYTAMFRPQLAESDLFSCLLCSKSVRSKWHHFQTHFSRNHPCEFCGLIYSRTDTLKTHIKKAHDIKIK